MRIMERRKNKKKRVDTWTKEGLSNNELEALAKTKAIKEVIIEGVIIRREG